MPWEERQILSLLGKTDFALLKLSEACTQDISDTRTLLITADKNLTRSAKHKGLPACRLSHLRSSEAMSEVIDTRPKLSDIHDIVSTFLDSDEEKPVKVRLTLEELRSEGDYLIACGSGRLEYDNERHPFRWTFPYENIGMAWEAQPSEERGAHDDAQFPDNWRPYYDGVITFWDKMDWAVVMPLENVDFMGSDERIPGSVRRFVCSMVESMGDGGQLHPPDVRVRMSLNFLMAMEWGPISSNHMERLREEGSESREELDLCEQHNRHLWFLLDGRASSFGDTFRKLFRSRKALERMNVETYQLEEGAVLGALDQGLATLLDDALDSWSVGETREEEFTYRPWPQELEERYETEEDDSEYGEEASEDDEDELPELDD